MYLPHDNSFNNEWHVWIEATSEYDTFHDVTYNDDVFFQEERNYSYFCLNLSIIKFSFYFN